MKRIEFYKGSKVIGVVDWFGPKLLFEGDADESAEMFFHILINLLEEELKATYLEGYNDALREKKN